MSKNLEKAARTLLSHRKRSNVAARTFLQALVSEMELSSGKALALEIGVSESYLSDVKHGRRDVSDALIDKILVASLK